MPLLFVGLSAEYVTEGGWAEPGANTGSLGGTDRGCAAWRRPTVPAHGNQQVKLQSPGYEGMVKVFSVWYHQFGERGFPVLSYRSWPACAVMLC